MLLVLHSTYTTAEAGLCLNGKLLDAISLDKHAASAQLIPALITLCKQASISIDALTGIVAHAGPGPFTTLRAVIATANGLAAATALPVIGVDGLRSFLQEHQNPTYATTIALLNAYNNDVYFAIEHQGELLETGVAYATALLPRLAQQFNNESCVRFIGNGVQLHEPLILELFGQRAYLPHDMPSCASLQQIALNGWQHYRNQNNFCQQLTPLYLKAYSTPTKHQVG